VTSSSTFFTWSPKLAFLDCAFYLRLAPSRTETSLFLLLCITPSLCCTEYRRALKAESRHRLHVTSSSSPNGRAGLVSPTACASPDASE
jgi:hypothetical protein